MLKKFYYLYHQYKSIRAINRKLKNGIDSVGEYEGHKYIKLKSGKAFISQPSPNHLSRLHFLLHQSIRNIVPAELVQTLFDINFRYLGQGDTQLDLADGKYFDVNKGDIVFEMGAYIGMHAMRLSELVGESGKVIAVEAIPGNYELMKKNIALNGISNIEAHNFAIWKNKGTISFNLNEHQKNSAVENIVKTKSTTELPCDTIDNVFNNAKIDKVDYIRIQTNGAELEALEGMDEIFNKGLKPKLLVACPYKNQQPIQEFLDGKGYKTSFTGHSILAIP